MTAKGAGLLRPVILCIRRACPAPQAQSQSRLDKRQTTCAKAMPRKFEEGASKAISLPRRHQQASVDQLWISLVGNAQAHARACLAKILILSS
jgi:hypothetical protein